MKVSEGTLERALQVMAQVVAVLERQGCSVAVSDTARTIAVINNERVFFGIEEPIRKVVVQKSRVANPTDRWDYDETAMQNSNASNPASRILSSDSRGPPSLRGGEKKNASEMRLKRKGARERAELQKDIQEEEEKLKEFDHWMDAWARAERMRRFIAAYAKKSSSWSAEKQPKYKAWIEWATQQADRADPFVSEKPPSVLDRKNELSR